MVTQEPGFFHFVVPFSTSVCGRCEAPVGGYEKITSGGFLWSHTGIGVCEIGLHFIGQNSVIWSKLTAKGWECSPSMCPKGKGNEFGDHTAFCFCHR